MLWQFEKPIVREFMHLALPTVLAGWVYIVYTITSGVFIGRFVGSQALAALNLILPVLYVPYAISLMIGIGAATLMARLRGEGKRSEVRRVCGQTLVLLLAGSMLLSGALLLWSTQIVAVLGASGSYVNAGIVDSWGTEIGLDYTKQISDVVFNIGGNFAWNRNEIKEQMEEPRLYDNLVQTGNRLNQVYGLIAEGFFKDEADIASSPTQNFSTVVPGDIKYKDVNGDGIIDEKDKTNLGSPLPKWTFGWNNTIRYKNFDLNLFINGNVDPLAELI